jgi:MFS family permease
MGKGAMPLLCAIVFVVSLGYGAGLPLVRPNLLVYLGAVPVSTVAWHVGMLGGVYLFALFLFAPLWGRLSDRHGRVWVLPIGFAAFLVATAATALAASLGAVYAARLLAGAGAAAIVPTAQAYIADCSTTVDRSRRFVLLGSASFVGFLSGPAFGTWLAGPVMGMPVGQMGGMLNWSTLSVAFAGLPLLLLAPWCLGRNHPVAALLVAKDSPTRKRFVRASMLLALLASFAVGTFEVGFNLFGSQTLGLTTGDGCDVHYLQRRDAGGAVHAAVLRSAPPHRPALGRHRFCRLRLGTGVHVPCARRGVTRADDCRGRDWSRDGGTCSLL